MRYFERRTIPTITVLVAILALLSPAIAHAEPPDFALKDGDSVVFLGDSITAARTYTKIIEAYTLLRFPQRKVRFYNAGIGGDTAAGSLTRLERDVFSRKPTVLTVCFGLNDIGWGMKANDEHKTRYIESLRTIIGECRKRNIRVFICSGPVTSEAPDKSEEGYLQKMCDEAFAMAKKEGAGTIDVQRPMREIQRRVAAANKNIADPAKQTKLHAADGVHLNELGHLAMAYAFLKGFDAPSEVSRARVDLDAGTSTAAGCQISKIRRLEDGCEFVRLDEGLPFNGGLFYVLNFLYVPMNRDFNGYKLEVHGLAEGKYTITVNGREVTHATAGQLAKGIDIASATPSAWQPGGPWDSQATLVKSLTESRHEIDTARMLSRLYLTAGDPLTDELDKQSGPAEEKVVDLQRLAAKPRPYQFVIRRKVDEPGGKHKSGGT